MASSTTTTLSDIPPGTFFLRVWAKRSRRATERRGKVYRLGGDEFCVLATVDRAEAGSFSGRRAEPLPRRARASSSTYPTARCARHRGPRLRDCDAARRPATLREQEQPAPRGIETTAVLLTALAERDSDLSHHLHGVAQLAEAVARDLKVSDRSSPTSALLRRCRFGQGGHPRRDPEQARPPRRSGMEYIGAHTIDRTRILDVPRR